MTTEIDIAWRTAEDVAQLTTCPANCAGRIVPKLAIGGLETILCFCDRCGFCLALSETAAGEMLVIPDEHLWRQLMRGPYAQTIADLQYEGATGEGRSVRVRIAGAGDPFAAANQPLAEGGGPPRDWDKELWPPPGFVWTILLPLAASLAFWIGIIWFFTRR